MKRWIIILGFCLIIPINFSKAEISKKQIKVFDFQGNLQKSIELENFHWNKVGDLAMADLGTDNIPEIIVSAAKGNKPYLKIYRLDGSLINEFLVYPESYLGGINFAVFDITQDGQNEIITAATAGGGPHVLILNSQGKVLKSFFAFNQNDNGGINVAVGNLYEDLKPEIIVSSNSHNKVRVFNHNGDFLAELNLKNDFRKGQRIETADLGDDGVAEIVSYANVGDQPIIYLYQNNGELISNHTVYDNNFKGGINLTRLGKQIFIGAGFGAGPHLKKIDGYNNVQNQFMTNNLSDIGGVKLAIFDNRLYTISEQFPTAVKDDDKYIQVDISEQKLKYFEDGYELGEFKISSGKKGYATPVGEFSILNKNKLQYSKKYNLYMPYWMNFYTIYGLHELPYWSNGYREGENHLGVPVSHGCVRLGIGPAKQLFDWAEVGIKVYINN